MAEPSVDIQNSLFEYQSQLKEVEQALTLAPKNEELLKLQDTLQVRALLHVITDSVGVN